ncbi:protein kinase domain-containing protein [Kallotenue papyrolyticum]|uniref:protein kinase domain-containing protein n=1 Tax=Kallotenue papyrolyticum TaxID=1325125 RepID=UPI0004785A89|nr:serine/threonine-protein kinase [Kallotenue papyrolyticum]
MNAVMTAQRDELAGRYRLDRLLGSGGFGAVYLATDMRLHRAVAIKVCSTNSLPPHEAAEAARLFQHEALTLARLRHPGLTAIWDYFQEGDHWYLVMEYVPGETLRDLLRRVGGPLPLAEALNYARQLCAVLGYLHSQQPPIVFRDLKPANIMVTPDGQLKLIDFGIARLFSPGKAADTAQFGTPGYAPPEQYGGQTEPRSDIYSLGVVVHQMITGHHPTGTPFGLPPANTLNPIVPAALAQALMRATAYAIAERFASAEEFCHALDAVWPAPQATATTIAHASLEAQFTGPATPATSRRLWAPPPRPLPARPRHEQGLGRTLFTIALIVLLLGALGGGSLLARERIISAAHDLFATGTVAGVARASTAPQFAVFSAIDQQGNENLHLLDLSNNTSQRLTQEQQPRAAAQPAISPDGQWIAFNLETRQGTSQVWVMRRDGSDRRRILPEFPFARAAAWSPDGRMLAVEVAEEGRAWHDHDIALVDLQTGNYRVLVATPHWEGGPSWSPDGRWIAYQGRLPSARCMQVFLLDVERGAAQPLTNLQACTSYRDGVFWPDWAPDGKALAVGWREGEREQIALLTLDGRLQPLDTGTPNASYPRWSRDGQALLFQRDKTSAAHLFRYDLQSRRVTPLAPAFTGAHLADWW